MLALGLNSGSSFDGIDAVLVDIDLGDDGLLKRPCFIAGNSVDWPKRVADRVLAAFENKLSIFELCRLNYVAGALYAEAARSLMRETQTPPEALFCHRLRWEDHLPGARRPASDGRLRLRRGSCRPVAGRPLPVRVADRRTRDRGRGLRDDSRFARSSIRSEVRARR